jgi:tetratricopeptide (TPR) repeat protein
VSFWTKLFRGGKEDDYQRGIKLFNSGDYDGAVEVLEKVIAEAKSKGSPIAKLGAFYAAEAHAKIGVALFYGGQLDRSLGHLEAALEENPHYPDLYYYLGVVQHHRGNLDEAIEHLEHATSLNEEYAEATCYLGIALHDAGFFERANEQFARALTLARKTPNPLSRVLVDKLNSKSFDLPILQELRDVVVENTGLESCVKEGTIAFNQGEKHRAIQYFAKAVGFKPEYPDLRCKLGVALLDDDQTEAALAEFEKAVELNPNYVEALYFLGIGLFYHGDYVSSRARLEQARKLNPDYADIHCQYGVLMLSLGDFPGAREALEKALEISDNYAKAHYLLGLTLHGLGDEEGATTELKTALQLQPAMFPAERDAGLHAMQRRDWRDAEQRFARLVKEAPRHADALCMLGSACLELDRAEEAKRFLTESLELNAQYTEARKKLALVYCNENDFEAADKLISEAIELNQNYPDLHKIRGDIRLKSGDLKGALESYQNSLSINPDYADAVFGLVIALRRDGNGREGDRLLKDYIERYPSDLMARTLLTVEKMKLPDA